jgi:hypothetical protein
MEKNKIQNKQSSVTSIKWLCARCGNCGNGYSRVIQSVPKKEDESISSLFIGRF